MIGTPLPLPSNDIVVACLGFLGLFADLLWIFRTSFTEIKRLFLQNVTKIHTFLLSVTSFVKVFSAKTQWKCGSTQQILFMPL